MAGRAAVRCFLSRCTVHGRCPIKYTDDMKYHAIGQLVVNLFYLYEGQMI